MSKSGKSADGLSSIEQHPRWGQVRAFLGVQPGDNGILEKSLRDLRRVEAEVREAGAGPNLVAEIARLELQIEELTRAAQPCRNCRRQPPSEIIQRLDAVENAHAAKLQEFEARRVRLGEIGERFSEAHAAAILALHNALKKRLYDLGQQANCLIASSPEVARRHPSRLPDSLLDLEREVRCGVDLAMAFSSPGLSTPGAENFWAGLGAELAPLVERKWHVGRSQSAVAVA